LDQLRAMKVFIRVIDEGGFAKAARALDMAPPVVTRVVAELEAHLGARLLNRTTRRIALTDVGEAYLEKARQILVDVEESEALASESTKDPRGHVRVLAPPAVAVHQLAKHLPTFRAQYPNVSLELVAPGAIETVDEDFDITILSVRKPIEGDFVARRLARSEVIMCASPEYLDRRGRPQHPADLVRHEVLIPPVSALQRGVTFFTGPWGDDEPGGDSFTVVPSNNSALRTAHVDTNYAAALAGLGIAGLPSMVIEDALMENALERVMPAWRLFSLTLWAAMPSRKHVPARTRALLDFLIQIFGGEDRDPWLTAARCETPLN
jgi:DNA-binding transcriptional LysR family regulator